MNKKIEILRKYAIKQFEKHKDDKNLKVVRSIILESLLEIINTYGEYINFENIDKVFNRKYKILVHNVSDNNHHEISAQFFNKNGENVYAQNGLIVLSYPVNELITNYDIELGLKDEFDLQLTLSQTKFLKDYFYNNEILECKADSQEILKNNNLIKDNFKIILQHEMSHAMSCGELYHYNNEIRQLIFPVTRRLWSSKKYVYDFLGGVLNTKIKMKNKSIANLEEFNNFTGYYLHEGITEYLVYKMKKEPIKKLRSFVHYGNKFITPSYAPYVWMMGCYNAIYNNLLIKAYYNGISAFNNNYKIINNIYKASKKFIISSQRLEEIQDDIESDLDEYNIYYNINEELFNKLSLLGLSREKAEALIKDKKDKIVLGKDIDAYLERMEKFNYKESENINELLDYSIYNSFFMEDISDELDEIPSEFNKIAKKMEKELFVLTKKLYSQYGDLNKNGDITKKQKREFKYCLLTMVDYKKTWDELTQLQNYFEDYQYDSTNLDKMKKYYIKLFESENNREKKIELSK